MRGERRQRVHKGRSGGACGVTGRAACLRFFSTSIPLGRFPKVKEASQIGGLGAAVEAHETAFSCHTRVKHYRQVVRHSARAEWTRMSQLGADRREVRAGMVSGEFQTVGSRVPSTRFRTSPRSPTANATKRVSRLDLRDTPHVLPFRLSTEGSVPSVHTRGWGLDRQPRT